ncbi:MAG: LdpA C-terminal domain-containing domain [Cyanobacteriota bacterium ELA615]
MGATLEHPLESLETSKWFKLICGASFQDLEVIRSLTLVYTLAGADCLDLSADPAVIETVRQTLELAESLAEQAWQRGYLYSGKPWLMVSLNDGEDVHFRKANFNPQNCPDDCERPCEKICPIDAINTQGVIKDKCYGCGRCIVVCPLELIEAQSQPAIEPDLILKQIEKGYIQAIEIHTQVGHQVQFAQLWDKIRPHHNRLKVLAISCPEDPEAIAYLQEIYQMITPLQCPLVWQTDGRPMSGDIGKGTTHATIAYAQRLGESKLPGYIQLAGGTNSYTVEKLKALGLRNQISGVAYGSYARSIVGKLLTTLDLSSMNKKVPNSLWQATQVAHELVAQFKQTA